MTPAEINEVLTSTLNTLGGPAREVIGEYTYSAAASSWALVVLSVAMGCGSYTAIMKGWKNDDIDSDVMSVIVTAAVIASTLAVIIFACNIGDALAPRAAGIHQFLKDVRVAP